MCFSCTEYAVVSLSDGLQSSKGCVSPALSMQLLVFLFSLLDGLQSSKGCVYFALSMQLSVFSLLVYQTVYNHPMGMVYNYLRDAFLLHPLCSRRSARYWPTGYGLPSSKACTSWAVIDLLVVSPFGTIDNYPEDIFFF